jgi:hypothetical protein
MRQVKQWLWLVSAPTLIASCALQTGAPGEEKTSKEVQDLVLTVGTRVGVEAVLNFPATVFAENPTSLIEAKDFHGYEFDGLAGGVVTITTRTNGSCGNLDTVLHLFRPENADGDRGANIALNDDAFLSGQCFLDSRINQFRLPETGTYLLLVTSFLQQGSANNAGHYRLTLTCNNNACVPDGTPTFQGEAKVEPEEKVRFSQSQATQHGSRHPRGAEAAIKAEVLRACVIMKSGRLRRPLGWGCSRSAS